MFGGLIPQLVSSLVEVYLPSNVADFYTAKLFTRFFTTAGQKLHVRIGKEGKASDGEKTLWNGGRTESKWL